MDENCDNFLLLKKKKKMKIIKEENRMIEEEKSMVEEENKNDKIEENTGEDKKDMREYFWEAKELYNRYHRINSNYELNQYIFQKKNWNLRLNYVKTRYQYIYGILQNERTTVQEEILYKRYLHKLHLLEEDLLSRPFELNEYFERYIHEKENMILKVEEILLKIKTIYNVHVPIFRLQYSYENFIENLES